MIRLVVIDQQGSYKELDTYGNENVNLTLQVDDVRNIDTKNASYSKEFNIPATKNNNKFFEHFHDVNRYNNNYNPYVNVKAFLYVEELLILEGFLRLVDVVEKNTEISYTVVLFNDVANIIETLGDATMADLDFSDIKHERSVTNIYNSWFNTGVTLTAGGTSTDVFYPYIENGSITILEDFFGYLNFDYYSSYVMNLRLKYVIDKIFAYAGFAYDSDFFNSDDFKNIYFDTDVESTVLDAVGETLECDGLDNALPATLSILGGTAFIPNWTNEDNDVDSAFNHNTSTYTAPYDTMLTITMTIDITATAFPATASLYLMGTYTDTSEGDSEIVTISDQFNYLVTANTITFSGQIDIQEGDTLQLLLYAEVGNLFQLPADGNYTLSITNSPQQPTESLINQGVGDIRLSDILKDVTQMFNLTIESKGNNKLKIEPYNDYISDTELDWTKKVDVNEFKLEPIEAPKRIEFHHAEETDDYYHDRYKRIQQIPFGSHYVELDVDSQDIVKIENNVFAAPYTKQLLNTNIYVQHITKQDGESFVPYANKPRLVYKRPASTNDDLFDFNALSVSSGVANEHTYNAHFINEALLDADTNDNSLLYGLINTIDIPILNNQPINTLFNKYWFQYINERYNVSNSLIMKIEANLTPTDIMNFSFSYKIRIQDQLFRVNKIEYNTDRTRLAKIELLRI